MIKTRTLSAIVLVVLLCGCASQPKATKEDAVLSDRIVGSWIVPHESSDYLSFPMRETFRADGTQTVYFFDAPNCEFQVGQIDSHWKIVAGVLQTTIVDAHGDHQFHAGDKTRERVVSIDDDKMVLRSLDGNTTRTRLRSNGCFDTRLPTLKRMRPGGGGS